jgi:hypothetical protein
VLYHGHASAAGLHAPDGFCLPRSEERGARRGSWKHSVLSTGAESESWGWGVCSYTGLPHPGPFTGFTRAAAFYQHPAKWRFFFFRDLFLTRFRRFTRGRKACGLRASSAARLGLGREAWLC